MSIQDKIQRLQTAKSNIATAITAKGGVVDGRDGFEEFANDIGTISAGSNLDDFISGRMTEVTSKLEAIPDFAFSAKGELVTVNIPEANYIGKFAFSSAAGAVSGSGSGGESSEGSEGDMNYNNKKLVTVNMPKVTNIETGAFQGDENLEITSLPSTLLVIQDKAFKGCPKVQLTAFPENITYIGDEALEPQPNIDLATLPEYVTYLGAGVTVDQITTYLSQYVNQETGILDYSQVPAQWYQMEISNAILRDESRFSGINLGTSIAIPSGVAMLANHLFYDRVREVTTLSIPNSVTSIGAVAFRNCNALTSLTIPDSVTSIGEDAFGECSSLTTLTIGDSVAYINDRTFTECNALTSLTIGNSVTHIGNAAFSNCQVLTSLTIPDSVISIGDNAFISCQSLTSLTIPDSVTSIGDSAFNGCYNLTDIYYTGTQTQWEAITGLSDAGFNGAETIHYEYIPN